MAFSTTQTFTEYNVTVPAKTDYDIQFPYIKGTVKFERVELWDDVSDPANPTLTVLVKDTDYTIDEAAFTTSEPPLVGSGSKLNLIGAYISGLTLNHQLFIFRDTDQLQLTNFLEGTFPADTVEGSDDKLMLAIQEIQARLDKAVINPTLGPTFQALDSSADIAALQAADIVHDLAIAALQAQINAAAPETIVIRSLGGAFPTSAGDFNVVKVAGVLLTLSATPALNDRVKIKQDNLAGTVVDGNGFNIDAAGTYILSSTYESVFLVFDGTQWYIN